MMTHENTISIRIMSRDAMSCGLSVHSSFLIHYSSFCEHQNPFLIILSRIAYTNINISESIHLTFHRHPLEGVSIATEGVRVRVRDGQGCRVCGVGIIVGYSAPCVRRKGVETFSPTQTVQVNDAMLHCFTSCRDNVLQFLSNALSYLISLYRIYLCVTLSYLISSYKIKYLYLLALLIVCGSSIQTLLLHFIFPPSSFPFIRFQSRSID